MKNDETTPTEAGLLRAALAWDRAMIENDADAIGRFMAADWCIIGADGGLTDRDTFLSQVRDGRLSHDTMTTEDVRVRIYGSLGVLVARGISGGQFEGHPFRVAERQSNVFVHQAGEWRCVLTHLSPLPTLSSEGAAE
jgi:ketosteroid isomerase-like protein